MTYIYSICPTERDGHAARSAVRNVAARRVCARVGAALVPDPLRAPRERATVLVGISRKTCGRSGSGIRKKLRRLAAEKVAEHAAAAGGRPPC